MAEGGEGEDEVQFLRTVSKNTVIYFANAFFCAFLMINYDKTV